MKILLLLQVGSSYLQLINTTAGQTTEMGNITCPFDQYFPNITMRVFCLQGNCGSLSTCNTTSELLVWLTMHLTFSLMSSFTLLSILQQSLLLPVPFVFAVSRLSITLLFTLHFYLELLFLSSSDTFLYHTIPSFFLCSCLYKLHFHVSQILPHRLAYPLFCSVWFSILLSILQTLSWLTHSAI